MKIQSDIAICDRNNTVRENSRGGSCHPCPIASYGPGAVFSKLLSYKNFLVKKISSKIDISRKPVWHILSIYELLRTYEVSRIQALGNNIVLHLMLSPV